MSASVRISAPDAAVGSGTLGVSRRDQAPTPKSTRPARRLPRVTPWPAWLILAAQLGILIAVIGGWEIGAAAGVVDAFFWSRPSAIFDTLLAFFASGDALTD